MNQHTTRIDIAPELDACAREIDQLIERWHGRWKETESAAQADALMIAHTGLLQAYAMWFTGHLDPRDAEATEKVRAMVLAQLQSEQTKPAVQS